MQPIVSGHDLHEWAKVSLMGLSGLAGGHCRESWAVEGAGRRV